MSSNTIKSSIVTVEGLTHSGQAFVHADNNFLRIGNFMPGDQVKVSYTEEPIRLESVEMIEPSPDRVKPDCYFHGPCGGCDLLELSEKGRKREKQAMIMRVLDRVTNGDKAKVHNFLSSKEIIRYLPRVRLHQSRNYEERESGFLAAEAYQKQILGGVVPVSSCALLTKAIDSRLVAACKILSQVPIFLESLTLMSSSSHRSDRVTGHAILMKGRPEHFHHEHLTKIMRAMNLKGLSVASSDGKIKKVNDSVSVTGLIATDVDGGPYDSEPSFFVQGNIYQNKVLIDKVVEFCQAAPGKRILEGFAGAGNFTLALAAKGATIEAIESHPGAVRAGQKNIARSGFADRVKLIQGDAIKEMAKSKMKPDVLLLDPPRNGTPSIGRTVSQLKPDRVVCIFCDLEAVERDSNAIIKSGYELTEAVGIDMYPRTHHIELVCLFKRKEE